MSAPIAESTTNVTSTTKETTAADQTTLTGEDNNNKLTSSSSQAASFSDESVIKGPPGVDMSTILTGKKLAVVFSSMLLCLLLIALDQTILATALPRIASDFNAFSSQGWVASSFVLTQTAFLLFLSQVLRIYPAKYVLLTSVTVFEVGSIVCGAAQNVNTLIFGRAFSGVGAAGIFIAMISILAQITLLKDRPRLFGLFGAVFGISSIIGPLMGGALTDKVSWRWCFFINVPVGAVTLVVVSFLLKASPPLGSDPTKRTKKDILQQTLGLDWLGGGLVLASVTCLVLALNWGGNTKPWNSAAVIATLVIAFAIIPVFVMWERHLGERAMVPGSIFKSISIYAIVAYAFMTRFSLLLFTYYIPIFYQAGRQATATASGVDLLPLMLAVVISVIASGQITGKTGVYWWWLFGGPVFLSVGAGLMYTVTEFTSSSAIIGFQILTGLGIGTTMQNSLFAMQAEFKDEPRLLNQATGMASFGQFLGGTIGLAVSQTVFSSTLSPNLAKYSPGVDSAAFINTPTSIYTTLSPEVIPNVVRAYVSSLQVVFVMGVPVGIISILLSLLIKNINIKKEDPVDAEKLVGLSTEEEKIVASPEKL